MNIYEISAEYQRILDKDEYSLDDMEALDKLHNSLENKAINVSGYILNIEAQAEGIRNAILNMKERAYKLESKAEYLRGFLKSTLQLFNFDKITNSPYFDIKIKKNPPKLLIFHDELLDRKYFEKVETIIRQDAKIKEALKAGEEVAGAQLIQDTRLEIK